MHWMKIQKKNDCISQGCCPCNCGVLHQLQASWIAVVILLGFVTGLSPCLCHHWQPVSFTPVASIGVIVGEQSIIAIAQRARLELYSIDCIASLIFGWLPERVVRGNQVRRRRWKCTTEVSWLSKMCMACSWIQPFFFFKIKQPASSESRPSHSCMDTSMALVGK